MSERVRIVETKMLDDIQVDLQAETTEDSQTAQQTSETIPRGNIGLDWLAVFTAKAGFGGEE